MSDFLQSNADGSSELAGRVLGSLNGYLDFSVDGISSLDPVSGSAKHDDLAGGICRALSAWEQLISSDATAIIDAAAEFGGVDSSIAQGLLGVGGDAT